MINLNKIAPNSSDSNSECSDDIVAQFLTEY